MGKRLVKDISKSQIKSQETNMSQDIGPLLAELETELQRINAPTSQIINNEIDTKFNNVNTTNNAIKSQLDNSSKSNLFKFNFFGKNNEDKTDTKTEYVSDNQYLSIEKLKDDKLRAEKNSPSISVPYSLNQDANIAKTMPTSEINDLETTNLTSKALSKESALNLLNKKLVNISSMESELKLKVSNIKSLMVKLNQLNNDFSKKKLISEKKQKEFDALQKNIESYKSKLLLEESELAGKLKEFTQKKQNLEDNNTKNLEEFSKKEKELKNKEFDLVKQESSLRSKLNEIDSIKEKIVNESDEKIKYLSNLETEILDNIHKFHSSISNLKKLNSQIMKKNNSVVSKQKETTLLLESINSSHKLLSEKESELKKQSMSLKNMEAELINNSKKTKDDLNKQELGLKLQKTELEKLNQNLINDIESKNNKLNKLKEETLIASTNKLKMIDDLNAQILEKYNSFIGSASGLKILNSNLKKKQKEIILKQKLLDNKKNNIEKSSAEIYAQLLSKEEELKIQSEFLISKEKEVQDSIIELKQVEKNLESKSKEIKKALKQKEDALNAKELEIDLKPQKQLEDLKNKTLALEKIESILVKKENELTNRGKELQNKINSIKLLEHDLRQKSALSLKNISNLKKVDETLRNKNKELIVLSKSIETKHETIENTQSEIIQTNKELKKQESVLKQKAEQILLNENHIKSKENAIIDKEKKLASKELLLNNKEAELKKLEENLKTKEKELKIADNALDLAIEKYSKEKEMIDDEEFHDYLQRKLSEIGTQKKGLQKNEIRINTEITPNVEDNLTRFNAVLSDCKNYISNQKFEDAKKAYNQLRLEYYKLEVSEQKKTELHNELRKIYDNINLGILSKE